MAGLNHRSSRYVFLCIYWNRSFPVEISKSIQTEVSIAFRLPNKRLARGQGFGPHRGVHQQPGKAMVALMEGISLPADFQNYANQLANYAVAMNNAGVPVYAISIQNEPDYTATYESCIWSAQQLHDFVPHLSSALSTAGVGS